MESSPSDAGTEALSVESGFSVRYVGCATEGRHAQLGRAVSGRHERVRPPWRPCVARLGENQNEKTNNQFEIRTETVQTRMQYRQGQIKCNQRRPILPAEVCTKTRVGYSYLEYP
eukprot:874973-Pleurochrysis_carterae.AAC.2